MTHLQIVVVLCLISNELLRPIFNWISYLRPCSGAYVCHNTISRVQQVCRQGIYTYGELEELVPAHFALFLQQNADLRKQHFQLVDFLNTLPCFDKSAFFSKSSRQTFSRPKES